MTTKLYHYVAVGNQQIHVGCLTADSREYAVGWTYSKFKNAEGFKPDSVEVLEVEGSSIRKAMPAALSEKIEVGQRSTGATLVDDTIVFHVAIKSNDPASIAHQIAEIEEECSEEEFTAALKIVMSNCAFLKSLKNN